MNQQTYVTSRHLAGLAARLGPRDRQVLEALDRLTLISGGQIKRLIFESDEHRPGDQTCRRVLLRLTRLGLTARLDRVIGGARRGSQGFVYRLAPAGERLVREWKAAPPRRGRRHPEPGERFVRHRLAVSELYVGIVEQTRSPSSSFKLADFEAEPDCWRDYVDRHGRRTWLKPDAYLRITTTSHDLLWFCEADLGTVSRSTREAQAAAYRAYWRSGAAGAVMPRVLWCGASAEIASRAGSALGLNSEPAGLFIVTTLDEAAVALQGGAS